MATGEGGRKGKNKKRRRSGGAAGTAASASAAAAAAAAGASVGKAGAAAAARATSSREDGGGGGGGGIDPSSSSLPSRQLGGGSAAGAKSASNPGGKPSGSAPAPGAAGGASPSQTQQQQQQQANGGNQDGSPPAPPSSSSSSYKSIRWCIVQNDPSTNDATTLQHLVALKSLFAKQLPKMPKEYIARLVFDRRHKSLAVLNPDESQRGGDDEIIGGICYRAYPEMKFAEIAFCAVSASQQVKGYGTKLMNLVKQHAVTERIEYFITYADNYAIGYFKKQGFTKSISMPKPRFHGLIKDYDGGTMMECYVHPSIDFTRIPEMIAAQREFILGRVRLVAKSHRVVYPPLKHAAVGRKGATAAAAAAARLAPAGGGAAVVKGSSRLAAEAGISSRGNEAAARAMAVPGVAEAGWTLSDLVASTGVQKDADRQRNHMKSEMLSLVRKTEEQAFSWPFRDPVDTAEVKDYLEIIKDPIDLSTIEKRIRKGDWYKSKQMLHADLMRMVNNCKLYNDSSSPYYECAVNLEKFLPTLFPDL